MSVSVTPHHRRPRVVTFAIAAAVALGALVAAPATAAATPVAPVASGAPTAAAGVDLGSGFVDLPSPASQWVAANPNDARTARIKARIAAQPVALWLTGPESYANLDDAVRRAKAANGTIVLAIYDIPGRWDGINPPSPTTLAQYRAFILRVATTLGSTRAAIVVEPDALWFVDRQTPAGSAAYRERMTALRYAVDTLAARATGSRVYLDAGTSSGSVTPNRMAALLSAAGVARTAGFAVNVSSFAPNGEIEPYAQAVRTALRTRFGIADPRYVADTSRNGNSDWDNSWCNPDGRLLGARPAVYSDASGLDAALWIKEPGTSDGDCGNGAGSAGGQFLPAVAYRQAA